MTVEATARRFTRVHEPPIFGVMRLFQRDRLAVMRALTRRGDDAIVAHFGPFPFYYFNSAELMHAVLVEHTADFDKGYVQHNALRPVLGNGLLISEGDFWRQQRKTLAPSFQPRHIRGYADTMGHYAEAVQAEWADGATINIAQQMMRLTMSIIGKVLFDADVLSESDTLGAAITTSIDYADYASMHLFPLPYDWPTPRNQRTRRAIAVLDSQIQGMIEARRRSGEARDDMLSVLLRAQAEDGSRMTDTQVRDEAVTLFAAGHETTATALAWCFYVLARYPAVYDRLQAEVDTVLQGRTPAAADLPQLPYTLQVFKETMRLYPPAYIISRMSLHDVDVAGYHVEQGRTVLMSPYTLHRRADYFPDPLRFDPERFTPENEKRIPRYAYLPFGAGPRICIGNHFALMEGQLLLAALAQRVRFRLASPERVAADPKITLRQRGGARLIVERRAPGGVAVPDGAAVSSGAGH